MMQLSDSVKTEIDHWLLKFPGDQRRSAVVAALLCAQEENGGWISDEVMDAVAAYLKITRIEVLEVATFYDMYELKPIGRHKIGVCTNISCLLRGSDEVVSTLKERLGVDLGQTTEDGRFTLRETECLGACANAPVCQLDNDQYHENLTRDKVLALVDRLEQEAASGK